MSTKTFRVGRNVGTMIAASLLSAVLGVIQIFWIPKVLSVSDYGYWRAFLLYTGYAGMLHLGLTDGALIAWSTQKSESGWRSFKSGLLAILAEHSVVLLLWFAAALFLLRAPLPHYALLISAAVCLYALLFNLVGLAQVYAQSQARFSLVAFGMTAPALLLVVGLALTLLTLGSASLLRLLVICLLAWLIVFVSIFAMVRRGSPHAGAPSAVAATGLKYVLIGWPVMLANTGYGLMQSADRITVNLTLPIRDFAVYSLSQSTVFVPVAIIAAISRVAFSHMATLDAAARSSQYRRMMRLLAAVWILLLPYYFVVEVVVNRYLKNYTRGLPSGQILLLSILFLSLIQVVQLNTYCIAGQQRRFLAGAFGAVVLAFVTAFAASMALHSLVAIAWTQVLSAGLWWLYNEHDLSHQTGQRLRDWSTIVAAFALGALGLFASESLAHGLVSRVFIYEAITLIPLLLLFHREFEPLVNRFLGRTESVMFP